MAKIQLNAKLRDGIGKNKVDKIRVEGMIPGVVYSKGEDNKVVEISAHEFDFVLRDAGMTTIVDMMIDGKRHPILIKEIQYHPYKNRILHVDFQGIKMDETIKLAIPVRLLNRDSIRLQPSVLMQVLDEMNIECLPGDIPTSIEYDVAEMTFEEPVMIKDLDIFNDEKITVFHDADEVVATLNPVSEVEEEEGSEEEEISAADVKTVAETESEEE
ncbi:MAG: 50S ribosomal protein L25 [Tissierellia bacterium]|nr:50S ribosomal protein L25 [Tissierellia bacterium]